MVHIVDITPSKPVVRSDPVRGKEAVSSRKSSSMPGAGPLKGRVGAQGTPAKDSGTATLHSAPHSRPRSNTGIWIQSPKSGAEQASKTPAVGVAKPSANDIPRLDLAAKGILKISGQPMRYVDDKEKSAQENFAALRGHVENLQGMLKQRDAAFTAQAKLRMQLNHLDGHAEPERYESWAQAASVELEAAFQAAAAAVSSMQVRLDAGPDSGGDGSDTEDYLDAQADWSSDVDSDTEIATPAKSEVSPQKNEDAPVKADALAARLEPQTKAADLAAVETSLPKGPESTPIDKTTAAESPAELALEEADRSRHEMATDLLALSRLNMGHHTSGALDLVGNVRAMRRKIDALEKVLATKSHVLQGHADLVAQLNGEAPAGRLDWPQFKKWEAAAAVRPDEKFDELAKSVSAIKARMRNGMEHLTRIEGYTEAEIFSKP
ncbi:hypothetical protein [Acidovorax sp. SUPP3334]|uniref:hypothetical protein n=1 Tax=Acidovorax sp. SUPP3334 TaxID=2920881 RepID=UPI0023DE2C30|nr:hypothetical protein [Acidovorax sp. SUPP3334]GKT24066.1 hypothetical protein AVHM3334_13630 [Acidovorax sp. SUPP3334]